MSDSAPSPITTATKLLGDYAYRSGVLLGAMGQAARELEAGRNPREVAAMLRRAAREGEGTWPRG